MSTNYYKNVKLPQSDIIETPKYYINIGFDVLLDETEPWLISLCKINDLLSWKFKVWYRMTFLCLKQQQLSIKQDIDPQVR